MAESSAPKKQRRLRPVQTMRERAAQSQMSKQPRLSRLAAMARPFRVIKRLRGLNIWRPFKVVGRFLGKFLVPPYLRSSFRELRLVTWPDRRQTFRLTSAVILFAVIFGVIVAIVDFGLDKLFKQVILR